MIAVEQALELIYSNTSCRPSLNLPLGEGLGKVLSNDIFSPIDLPSFENSAMDGYAVKQHDRKVYHLIGESKAGDSTEQILEPGQAVRVFTGAALPKNSDTVIIQEWAREDQEMVFFSRIPRKTANIRKRGEQLKRGELVFQKGTILNESSLGLLAGLGLTKVEVITTPRVAILVTGNELLTPGEDLIPGCIYDSNSIMLESALKKSGIEKVELFKALDSPGEISKKIKEALVACDMLLVSGGISVGAHDHVKQSFKENGIKQLFYKVNQKPGKPLWYGTKGEKFVFGLPGNPASSLACFYIYVLPALQRMRGKPFYAPVKTARVLEKLQKPEGKTCFYKACLENGGLKIFSGQSSSMLDAFAASNALVWVPEETAEIPVNGTVRYLEINTDGFS